MALHLNDEPPNMLTRERSALADVLALAHYWRDRARAAERERGRGAVIVAAVAFGAFALGFVGGVLV